MERYRCDSDEAGAMLSRWARDVAVEPRVVAAWLMTDTTAVRRSTSGPFSDG